MSQTIYTSIKSAADSLAVSIGTAGVIGSIAAGTQGTITGYGSVKLTSLASSSILSFTGNQAMADYDLTFASVTGSSVATRYDLDFSAVGTGVKVTMGDTLVGNIAGSAYSDTLIGGKGNDTFTGGAGKDLFSVSGSDVVKDYTYGDDSLSAALSGATITAANATSFNVALDPANVATLQNVLSDGVAKVSGTDVAVWQSFASSTRTMDASTASQAVLMKASSYGDVMIGGSKNDILVGGIGNDQFWGGAGDDSINATLNGAAGTDIIYWGTGNGNDTISGFNSNDLINLYNANVADLSFATIGSGAGNEVLTLGTGTSKTQFVFADSAAASVDSFKIMDKNGVTQKVTFALANTSVDASLASDKYVSAGNGSIDFSNTAVASVDLNSSQFTKFASVKGSNQVRTTLVGLNTASSTLTAGSLGADLWGGGSQVDSLTGMTGVSDTFWVGSTDGKDVLNGEYGVGNTADIIRLYDTSDVKTVSYANGTLKLNTTASVSLAGGNNTSAIAGAEFKLQDASGNITKVWYADSVGTTAGITASLVADYYKGGAGTDGLDFSNTTNAIATDQYIWLGDTTKYSSIENVKGTANGNDTLIGSAAGSLTSGGNGTDVFWGGSSKAQTMVGGTGTDTFWFGAGDGKDVVSGYTAGNDTVHLYSQTGLAGTTITVNQNATTTTNTDVNIALNSSDVLTVSNLAIDAANGTTITFTDGKNATSKAVVAGNGATSLKYASDANLYYANSNNTTLVVSGSDNANVFLGNGWGTTANSGALYQANKITNVDATSVTGGATVVLAGYSGANNTFTGSTTASVTTLMWGGGASNDTFYAGTTASGTGTAASSDYIYFGTGDGKDEVKTSGTEDRVVLYADKLADITSSLTGGKLVLTTKAGDTLTIDNWSATSGLNTFQVGTDTTTLYQYDATKKTFVTK